MSITSRTHVRLGLDGKATLADLREMLAEADRLGAPGSAKVNHRAALDGLVAGLVIEWTPDAVEPEVADIPPAPATCRCSVAPIEATPPGHEAHRPTGGSVPVACCQAARAAADGEQPNITVVGLGRAQPSPTDRIRFTRDLRAALIKLDAGARR